MYRFQLWRFKLQLSKHLFFLALYVVSCTPWGASLGKVFTKSLILCDKNHFSGFCSRKIELLVKTLHMGASQGVYETTYRDKKNICFDILSVNRISTIGICTLIPLYTGEKYMVPYRSSQQRGTSEQF